MKRTETSGQWPVVRGRIRHSSFIPLRQAQGLEPVETVHPSSLFSIASFTLIELLTVITIIVLLAGMIMGTATYANRKSLQSKTHSQLHQMTLALELYKNDFGYFPVSPHAWPKGYSISHATVTTVVDANTIGGAPSYITSNSWSIYRALLGYSVTTRPPAAPNLGRNNYFLEVKVDQIQNVKGTNYLVDPYGNVWGYYNAPSTALLTNQYNPRSYDLWSYGLYPVDPTNSLISNWRQQ